MTGDAVEEKVVMGVKNRVRAVWKAHWVIIVTSLGVLLSIAAVFGVEESRPEAIARDLADQAIHRGRQGRFDLAVELLSRAAQLAPSDPEIRYNLGEALFAVDQKKQAAEQVYAACRMDLGNADYRFEYARILSALGEVDLALEALLQAVEAGFCKMDRLNDDPEFNAIKFDPRYAKIAEELQYRCNYRSKPAN